MRTPWLLDRTALDLDLDLTLEDLMHDLDPGWDSLAWPSPGAGGDVAAPVGVAP